MNRSFRRWLHVTLAGLAIASAFAIGGCGQSTTTATGTDTPTPAPPLPEPVEIGGVVRLVEGQGCVPDTVRLKRGIGKDHVRWHNPGSLERTIKFTAGWPFMEPETSIVIAAGKWSAWFSLAPRPVDGDYTYKVTPTLVGPGVPPEGPVISAGD